jgi:hypothetical protein
MLITSTCVHMIYVCVTQFNEVALAIRKDMAAKYSGTWHVIVGGQFGAEISHETSTVGFLSGGVLIEFMSTL